MYRKHFPAVLAQDGVRFFFDNAATTQFCEDALNVYQHLPQHLRANVSRGVYDESEKATESYEQSRKKIAHILGVSSEEIVFSRGTTDGLNTAARCICERLPPGSGILVSEAEHHSNYLPWKELARKHQLSLYLLPANDNGSIDYEKLALFSAHKISVVAITHCSNVTGLITDISIVRRWCDEHNVLLVVDGAQMPHFEIPKLDILDVDVYCFSGHKAYAANAIGVLYAKKTLLEQWEPAQWGGGMVQALGETDQWLPSPNKFEAGTPPYLEALTLANAFSWLSSLDQQKLQAYHQDLFESMHSVLSDYDFIEYLDNGEKNRSLIFSFNIKKMHSHDVVQFMSVNGFCLRAGQHCAIPLMRRLGLNDCVRLSLACYNTSFEVEHFSNTLKSIYEHTKRW